MSLETGRPKEEQIQHEFLVIKGLEDSHYAKRHWGNKETPEIYRTRFIDAMLRIQAGDIHSIEMFHQIDLAHQEIVQLKLPIIIPLQRNFNMTIQATVENLEKTEPNVRDLLPDPTSQ